MDCLSLLLLEMGDNRFLNQILHLKNVKLLKKLLNIKFENVFIELFV